MEKQKGETLLIRVGRIGKASRFREDLDILYDECFRKMRLL